MLVALYKLDQEKSVNIRVWKSYLTLSSKPAFEFLVQLPLLITYSKAWARAFTLCTERANTSVEIPNGTAHAGFEKRWKFVCLFSHSSRTTCSRTICPNSAPTPQRLFQLAVYFGVRFEITDVFPPLKPNGTVSLPSGFPCNRSYEPQPSFKALRDCQNSPPPSLAES